MSTFNMGPGRRSNIDESISDHELETRIAELKAYPRLSQAQSEELRTYEHHLGQRERDRRQAMLARALGVSPDVVARAAEGGERLRPGDLNLNPNALERVPVPDARSDKPNPLAGSPEAAQEQRREATSPTEHPSLLVSQENLRQHAAAIAAGRSFGADEPLQRSAVTAATDMGSPATWGSGRILGPSTLRAFAGIVNTPLTGVAASMPSLTLPAGAAGVAEGAQHGEFDAVDREDLAALRYGRWTTVTAAVDAFDELVSINGAHAVGIARDLNLADVTAIETAAGTPTAFDANLLDQNVREAVLTVAEAAMVDPSDVVLFGTAAALAVVTGFAPASGGDRGSVSTRVYGARVYATAAATAGEVTAFAPGGFRTFGSGLRSTSAIDPKDGSNTFGSWLHSTPAGVAIVGSAKAVDVTP
jgi:hypothetical protein